MMNAITKYERRHSIHNDDISLGIAGVDDWSTDTTSFCSTSSIFDDTSDHNTAPKKSMPQHHRWKIDASEISELPEIYPRLSSPLIVRDREISEIGDHLWRFLRANEIRSAYDSEEGRVLCCTNRVSFVVQFWRRKLAQEDDENNTAEAVASEYFPTIHDHTPTKKNSFSNSCDEEEEIILEIQRRKGCSWTMHKIRSAMKKWILRKQQQLCPGGSHYHHCNEKGMSRFPPPLQRSKSERFGLVGFDPIFLASNITPFDRIRKPIATTTAQDVASSIPFNHTPPQIRKPCSANIPPIRPAFESFPPPVWCSAKVNSSEEHRFTTIELKD